MLFNTWTFLIFFVIVLGLYYSLRRRPQNLLLLASSYVFYGWWDWRFLGLLLISTVVDFTVARLIASRRFGPPKLWLMVSICTNLGILGFFKYFNFFIDSAAEMLSTVGMNPNMPALTVILPVGISFYTFQTMGYTIDVYRGKCQPTRDPVVFGVYVAFFPQLVAGPIERASHLIRQFSADRVVTGEMFRSGLLLVLIGLVRKVAIADAVAGEVDAAFAQGDTLSGPMLARGVLLFAIQIYGDFAGYTDMARGVSRMLGIELMENFQHPYFSRSITEFWRRWHVSLSTWLRDYLYIPLGGNRGTRWFVYRNLMLTMLLGGLWHGAAWTFVIWGAIQGFALIIHKAMHERFWKDLPPRDGPGGWLGIRPIMGWGVTMAVVLLSWAFFRAEGIGNAYDVLEGIITMRGGFGIEREALLMPLGMILLLLTIDLPQYWSKNHTVMLSWGWFARGVAYASLLLSVVLLRPENDVAFIYFQF